MARDPTLSDEMRNALDEATAAMDRHAVSYALIGGIAASYRSQPRFTKDIPRFKLTTAQIDGGA